MKERTIVDNLRYRQNTKGVLLEGKDKDGVRLFKVPLGNSDEFALIEASEYNRLRELGLSNKWSLGANSFVKAPCKLSKTKYVSVARVITEAGNQEVVLYRDRNPLNLRQRNLAKKWSPRRDLKNDLELVMNLNAN